MYAMRPQETETPGEMSCFQGPSMLSKLSWVLLAPTTGGPASRHTPSQVSIA